MISSVLKKHAANRHRDMAAKHAGLTAGVFWAFCLEFISGKTFEKYQDGIFQHSAMCVVKDKVCFFFFGTLNPSICYSWPPD